MNRGSDAYIVLLREHSDARGHPYLLGVMEYYGVYGLRELNEEQLAAYAARHGLIDDAPCVEKGAGA